jgi:hypothetical protein
MLEESIIFLTSSLSYKAQLSPSPFLCKGFFSFKTRNVERKKKEFVRYISINFSVYISRKVEIN